MAKYKNIHIDIYKRDITVFIGSHSEFIEWIKNNEPSEKWENLMQLIINSDDSAEASFWFCRLRPDSTGTPLLLPARPPGGTR